MFIKIVITLFICGICLNIESSSFRAIAESASEQEAVVEEFEQTLQNVNLAIQFKDLGLLEKITDEIHKKWLPKDEQHYILLMLRSASALNSYDFGKGTNDLRYVLAQKYAYLALQNIDEMPPKTEGQFLLILMSDPEYSPKGNDQSEKWTKSRSKKVQLMLDFWKRVNESFDPNFNFGDRPSFNVCPPVSTGLRCGVSPEDMQDPKSRAEYQDAIAKNEQKGKKYDEQYNLRIVKERVLPRIEKFLISAYSKSPYNTEELEQFLNLYVKDDASKKILTEVTEAIQRNVQNDKGNNSPKSPPQ